MGGGQVLFSDCHYQSRARCVRLHGGVPGIRFQLITTPTRVMSTCASRQWQCSGSTTTELANYQPMKGPLPGQALWRKGSASTDRITLETRLNKTDRLIIATRLNKTDRLIIATLIIAIRLKTQRLKTQKVLRQGAHYGLLTNFHTYGLCAVPVLGQSTNDFGWTKMLTRHSHLKWVH